MHLNGSSEKWRPFCYGLNVLKLVCFSGTEGRIENCKHDGWGNEDCLDEEDIGVLCGECYYGLFHIEVFVFVTEKYYILISAQL